MKPNGVQTLERALSVLDLFRPDHPEWAAADVARELGLTLPTTGRLMRALEQRRLLMRVEGRRFRLGFGAVELGFRALESIDLRQRLHGLLARVARESGESSLLGVVSEHGNSARLIDRVEAREMIRISLEIGHLWPLHAGALGKALLAYMPDREITLEQPPEQVGKNTITDTVVLRRELEKIREIGWAMSVEETDAGVWGVAKTILDNDGMPIAAIGLVAPLGRLTPEYTSRLVALLEAALPEARKRLGLDASDDES